MNVLVACEFSGIVRDAFIARGHNAISVDLLPSERPGPHIIGDVLEVLADPYRENFSLMIAHPPCTYLTNAGVRWMYGGGGFTIDPERFRLMEKGAAFFRALLDVHIPHIAVENPIMHYMAKQAIGPFNGTIQTVQPWQYGTGETKGTQLWLKGLPELVPTNIVSGRTPRVHYASPGPDRWKERSRTDPNIADAMADQWSWYLRNLLP